MTQIEHILIEVAQRWGAQGIELLPSASRAELDEFETSFGIKFPDDFATYLMTLGGMAPAENDEHWIRFWPLSELEPDVDRSQVGSAYLAFADFGLLAHKYAISLSPQTSSEAFLIDGPPEKLASSFTEFLTLYLNDIRAIDGYYPRLPSSGSSK